MPRVPLRVWATLVHRGAEWRVETEDVGPGGCLVRSERLLVPGLDVRIVIQKSAISEELTADGKVAWYDAPRAGIAFDPRPLRARAPSVWFRKLLAADRRLAVTAARSPAEVELETRLFLPTPPRIVDLCPDEALIVGCAEQGMPVRDLLTRAGLSDERLGQVVLGLLEKRVFTLAAGEAGEAWKWRAALAGRRPGPRAANTGPKPDCPQAAPTPTPAAAPSAPSRPPAAPTSTSGSLPPNLRTTTRTPTRIPIPTLTPIPTATPIPALTPIPTPVPALAAPSPAVAPSPAPAGSSPTATARARYEPSTGATVMARILHGVGSTERPPGAETELGRAREAAAAGRVADAILFMRRALAMAPQDREIAGELARLAFIQPAP